MAGRKNDNAARVDSPELARVKKLVKEHEDNGRTNTYWHGILAQLEAAQPVPVETTETIEQESEKDSEVTNGSSD